MTDEIKKNQMMDEELDQVTGGRLAAVHNKKKCTSWIKSTASTAASVDSQTIVTSWI